MEDVGCSEISLDSQTHADLDPNYIMNYICLAGTVQSMIYLYSITFEVIYQLESEYQHHANRPIHISSFHYMPDA